VRIGDATLGELRRRLASTRATGYGTNIEETEQGVCGLGVTVHTSAGRSIAAFTPAVHAAAADTAQRRHDLGRPG
jgi:DNA-binding IclR family transcriptional regulator